MFTGNLKINDVKSEIAQLVKSYRKQQKLTQQELADQLELSRITIQNLELLDSNRASNGEFGGQGNSLLQVLDTTVSPMGSRMLRRWLLFPLQDIPKINERLNTVEYFIKEQEIVN